MHISFFDLAEKQLGDATRVKFDYNQDFKDRSGYLCVGSASVDVPPGAQTLRLAYGLSGLTTKRVPTPEREK